MEIPRLRDFIRDTDGWLYAVCAYDNHEKIGCILRYVPDANGQRTDESGQRYNKIGFEDAYALIEKEKPEYSDIIQRVPVQDVVEVLKPDEHIQALASGDERISRLLTLFRLPKGKFGVTGSMLCGLAGPDSDIDGVVYGNYFPTAQNRLRQGIMNGTIEDLDEELWHRVYKKREPELPYDEFLLHEQRKWNRGQIEGTYFDLLYTRDYADIQEISCSRGEILGKEIITADVTDATLGFDSPARFYIDHPDIDCILSFTHTYSGQVQKGETAQACGVIERHGDTCWLVIGTTRQAKGEYIRSLSLIEQSEEI